MKRLFLLILYLVVCSCIVVAFPSSRRSVVWDVNDVNIFRNGIEGASVELVFDILSDAVEVDEAFMLRPFLVSDGIRTELKPLVFFKSEKSERKMSKVMYDVPGFRSGRRCYSSMSSRNVTSSSFISRFAFSEKVDVYVDVLEISGRGDESLVESRLIASFEPLERPSFEPEFYPVFIDECHSEVLADTVILRLPFEDGSSSIDLDNEVMAAPFDRFCRDVSGLVLSSLTRVSSISLIAYSGIVGEDVSDDIMYRRCQNIRSLLQKRGALAGKNMVLRSGGFDRSTIGKWIGSNAWSSDSLAQEALSSRNPVKSLKAHKRLWRDLENYVLGDLERYECILVYRILPYRSSEDRWAAYNTDQRLLTAYDFSEVLRSLETWNSSWYNVAFDFAECFPHCQEAQINAMAACLKLGSITEASKYMRKIQSLGVSGNDFLYYSTLWYMYSGSYETAMRLADELDLGIRRNAVLFSQVSKYHRWMTNRNPWQKTVYKRYSF